MGVDKCMVTQGIRRLTAEERAGLCVHNAERVLVCIFVNDTSFPCDDVHRINNTQRQSLCVCTINAMISIMPVGPMCSIDLYCTHVHSMHSFLVMKENLCFVLPQIANRKSLLCLN